MSLEILPTRTGGAAENMATDFLLLQRYPGAAVPRFRHYEWRAPAFTFGYGQKLAFVRAQLPPDEIFDLCRIRPVTRQRQPVFRRCAAAMDPQLTGHTGPLLQAG